MSNIRKPGFRDLLADSRFAIGAELVSTRGLADTRPDSKLVEMGTALAADPRIGWISVTDNPGGNPMLPPDWPARIVRDRNCPVVIHLTCKDLNRNALESAAWRCAAEGYENILALTGDYPVAGYGGTAQAVFDLDSSALIALLSAMNRGLQVPGRKGQMEILPPSNFFIGCAVSPFKRLEKELVPQFLKLSRKIRSGAQWVILQLGYDMRKAYEVKLFLDMIGFPRPIIGNVYLLNRTGAGVFHDNMLPGCVVSTPLRDECEKQAASPDKGAKFFQDLAARQLAAYRSMGFAAGYLAGIARTDTFFKIIDLANAYSLEDGKEFARQLQYPQENEFYFFEQDPSTELGIPGRLHSEYLKSLKKPPRTRNVTLGYRISRRIHDVVFTPGTRGFKAARALYSRLDRNPDGPAARALHNLEFAGKACMYGCKDCGDCALPDCAYLCPRQSCSKCQRNGPCGGSFNGRCEVGEKDCIWTRIYDRARYYGELEPMFEGEPIMTNGALQGTSSWANLFLGRDHRKNGANAEPGNPESPKR